MKLIGPGIIIKTLCANAAKALAYLASQEGLAQLLLNKMDLSLKQRYTPPLQQVDKLTMVNEAKAFVSQLLIPNIEKKFKIGINKRFVKLYNCDKRIYTFNF